MSTPTPPPGAADRFSTSERAERSEAERRPAPESLSSEDHDVESFLRFAAGPALSRSARGRFETTQLKAARLRRNDDRCLFRSVPFAPPARSRSLSSSVRPFTLFAVFTVQSRVKRASFESSSPSYIKSSV